MPAPRELPRLAAIVLATALSLPSTSARAQLLAPGLEAQAGIDAPPGTVAGALVFQVTPLLAFGRLAPHVSLAIGFGAGRASDDAAGSSPGAGGASSPRAESGAAAGRPPRVDSAWLAPTALTVPAGSVTLALYEAVLLRLTVGVTDRLQVWAGTSWTDLIGRPIWEAGAKVGPLSVGRFRLALLAQHFGVRFSAWTGYVLTGAGPVASVCLDDACASVLSLCALAGWVHADNDDARPTTTTDVLLSPSAVIPMGESLKLVVEVHLPWTSSRNTLWAAGVRFPLGRWSLDLGAVGTFSRSGEVAPAGTLGYRW